MFKFKCNFYFHYAFYVIYFYWTNKMMLEGKIKRLANVIIDLLVDEFLPVQYLRMHKRALWTSCNYYGSSTLLMVDPWFKNCKFQNFGVDRTMVCKTVNYMLWTGSSWKLWKESNPILRIENWAKVQYHFWMPTVVGDLDCIHFKKPSLYMEMNISIAIMV